MTTAVYTAITNGFSQLAPHPHIPGVDWIAFLDGVEVAPAGDWEIRLLDYPHSPRLLAKGPKIVPQVFLPEYEHTIWIDGAYEVTDPGFVDQALACINESDMALWRHPDRDCIYDEADASLALPKYQGVGIERQVAHYRKNGHPAHWGLWSCGAIARRHSPLQERLSKAWYAEVGFGWGSVQDQISFPFCLRWLDMPMPGEFPMPPAFYGGPWLRHRGFHLSR